MTRWDRLIEDDHDRASLKKITALIFALLTLAIYADVSFMSIHFKHEIPNGLTTLMMLVGGFFYGTHALTEGVERWRNPRPAKPTTPNPEPRDPNPEGAQ